MSKWPNVVDREWPRDIPGEYFYCNNPYHADGITWQGVRCVIIGLLRRVEELEKQLGNAP